MGRYETRARENMRFNPETGNGGGVFYPSADFVEVRKLANPIGRRLF